MSFDKLILSPASISALYNGVLVQTGGETPEISRETTENIEVIPTQPAYQFVGKNLRKICMVVNIPGKEVITDNHSKFLSRMLEACKLTTDDVAIVNHAINKVENKQLKNQFHPQSVVLFGMSPEETGLPLSFPSFQLYKYDSVSYLHVPSIDVLNQDSEEAKLLKSKLWVCLRQLFQV